VLKKILAVSALAIFCFGTLAFGQNSNSSTTMQSNSNMSNMGMHRRRHRRRHHRRHWRRHMRRATGNTNSD